MLKALLKALGFDYRLPHPVEAIPLDDAVLCQNCNVITRPSKHGRCPVCESEAILGLRHTALCKELTRQDEAMSEPGGNSPTKRRNGYLNEIAPGPGKD